MNFTDTNYAITFGAEIIVVLVSSVKESGLLNSHCLEPEHRPGTLALGCGRLLPPPITRKVDSASEGVRLIPLGDCGSMQ